MHTGNSKPSQKIIPHLWFDAQAEEAAEFYTSVFGGSGISNITRYARAGQEVHGREPGSVMTVEFDLAGLRVMGLNGGPVFSFTPAISFFVTCETAEEVDACWGKLAEEGTPLMPLDRYDWSEKYGWIRDRYGLTWQLSLGKGEEAGRKVMPCLMYVSGKGRAERALNLYTTLFGDSEITGISYYGAKDKQPEGTVRNARFKLAGEAFMAMDTSPDYADFTFNEAVSLLVQCEQQEEIDRLWDRLSSMPEAEQCGWLMDPFGVSWQVTPTALARMLQDADREKVERVTAVFMQMKKLDIGKLQAAFQG